MKSPAWHPRRGFFYTFSILSWILYLQFRQHLSQFSAICYSEIGIYHTIRIDKQLHSPNTFPFMIYRTKNIYMFRSGITHTLIPSLICAFPIKLQFLNRSLYA